ncbi:progestin and adipoQ receptor family member 3-like isoform X2 [Ptychodera flava]
MDELSQYTSHELKKRGIALYSYVDVPHFLKGNPFILTGYRAHLPPSLCIKSLFVWSNETLNIWTHLIGFFIFLFLCIYDNVVIIPRYEGTWVDHVMYSVFLTCFEFCMLCSAGYHLFCCHSEKVCKWWLSLDLAGISVGLLGCYVPAVYYAFYCFTGWQNFYLIVVSCLMLVTLFMQLHPRYLTSRWALRRLALLCTVVGFGIIPVTHWIYLHGGYTAPIVLEFLPKVAVMYVLGILALLFYATKFPERCCPGKVDYIGSSHQWWHVIVVIAFLWWHHSGLILMEHRYNNPCTVQQTVSS